MGLSIFADVNPNDFSMKNRKGYVLAYALYIIGLLSACNTEKDRIELPDNTTEPEDVENITSTYYAEEIGEAVEMPSTFFAGMNGRSSEGPSWDNPQFQDLVNLMRPAYIRYPAGTMANSWDWRTGGLLSKKTKYPYTIQQLMLGKPASSRIIYVVNMARPTPNTGFTSDETEEVLKSKKVLDAKVIDMLEAIQEFEKYGDIPDYIELGNEFYFDNEHAAIYAANPQLYLEHSETIAKEFKKVYPTIKVLLCTTRGGSRGRDAWNNYIFEVLKQNKELKSLFHGVVQHHYINENYGVQTPIASKEDSEIAIKEGLDYKNFMQADYDIVPIGMKLWITEYGVTKNKEYGGMWAVGLQYIGMSISFLELGNKIEHIDCHHITLEPNVINKDQMKLGPVGVAFSLFAEVVNNATHYKKVKIVTTNTNQEVAELIAFQFTSLTNEKKIFILNPSQKIFDDVNLKILHKSDSRSWNSKQYWSNSPYINLVYDSNGIEIAESKSFESYTVQPFSITSIIIK